MGVREAVDRWRSLCPSFCNSTQTVININTQPSNWHHAAFYCWISDTDSFSFFLVNTKPDKRLTRNKHAHFLPLECIVSTQSTSSVEKLINKVMSLIILPKLLLVCFFPWEQRLDGVFQLHCGCTAMVMFGTTESESRDTFNSSPLLLFFWCSLVSKNHSWWSKLLQRACCCVKQPSPSRHLVTEHLIWTFH